MSRPLALVCYICGREFGTKSLAIHIKACQKKWENQENLKPPKQRRPCPQPPKGFNDLVSKDKITRNDINQFNTKSFDTFVEQALVECEYCSRKFNPKSLIPHQKACKISPMIKKPYINKGPLGKIKQQELPITSNSKSYSYQQQEDQYGNQNADLTPCRKCGRKFLPDRVSKHQRVCKAERVQIHKPQKQIQEQKPSFQKKPAFGQQKQPKWKVQHQQLQNAMRQMRKLKAFQAKGGKLSDLPPPPSSNYDHYIQCRYCGRKYAPDVAERHIPKCANIINKPGGIKPSKIQQKYVQGTGSGAKSYGSSGFGSSSIYQKPKPSFDSPTTKLSSNLYGKPNNSKQAPIASGYSMTNSSTSNNYGGTSAYGNNYVASSLAGKSQIAKPQNIAAVGNISKGNTNTAKVKVNSKQYW